MTPKGNHSAADGEGADRSSRAAQADQRIYIEKWCPVPPPGRRNRIIRYDGDRLDQTAPWDDEAAAADADSAGDLDAGW